MQAIVQQRYGGPEVLVSREIERPGIGDRDVLVRVHAAGLHIGDVFGVRGSPFPVRFTSGLRGPRFGVPGFDIAGTVEAIGSAVTRFAPVTRSSVAASGRHPALAPSTRGPTRTPSSSSRRA